MVDLREGEPVSFRTKLFAAGYLASGLCGLMMALWFVVVLLIHFVSGEKAAQSLPVNFLFPCLPVAVLVMLVAKFAWRWSCRKDRASRTS
jgi:hypothetical protein